MIMTFRPVTSGDAADIASWRYPAPYDFYDWHDDDDPSALLSPMADCVVADNESGGLTGFACFGAAGRVRGGEQAGLYGEPLLDIGLGLRPDLTGHGLGAEYCQSILDYAEVCYRPHGFRLSVATFNRRAIRVYERVGFVAGETFLSEVRGETVSFRLMRRWNRRSPEPTGGFLT